MMGDGEALHRPRCDLPPQIADSPFHHHNNNNKKGLSRFPRYNIQQQKEKQPPFVVVVVMGYLLSAPARRLVRAVRTREQQRLFKWRGAAQAAFCRQPRGAPQIIILILHSKCSGYTAFTTKGAAFTSPKAGVEPTSARVEEIKGVRRRQAQRRHST